MQVMQCGSALFSAPPPARVNHSWKRLPHVGAGQNRLRCAGLGDQFRDFMDSIAFENWAPRSSRTWRLGQQPNANREGSLKEDDIAVLNERLASARRAGPSGPAVEEEEEQQQAGPSAAAEQQAQAQAQAAQREQEQQQRQPPQELPDAFTRSTDEDFADALNKRIVEVASSLAGSMDDDEEAAPADELTGRRLRELVYSKYGKTHDLSFVRRDLPGKTLVSLNVMFPHLEQRSFPMSEGDYMEKLDGIALYLRAWSQDERVMDFLKAPAAPRHGLPARPIVGTAVSIHLDLEQAVIDEFFPQR